MQEFCVKKKDSVEVVAMIGAFGLLVSACEMYPFHWALYILQSRACFCFLKLDYSDSFLL